MSETTRLQFVITSDEGEARTATIDLFPTSILVTANSKSKRVYSNEPTFVALMKYLGEEEASW
jgi:hypothetical protein